MVDIASVAVVRSLRVYSRGKFVYMSMGDWKESKPKVTSLSIHSELKAKMIEPLVHGTDEHSQALY